MFESLENVAVTAFAVPPPTSEHGEMLLGCTACQGIVDQYYPALEPVDRRLIKEAWLGRPCPRCGVPFVTLADMRTAFMPVLPEERGFGFCVRCRFLKHQRTLAPWPPLGLICYSCRDVFMALDEVNQGDVNGDWL